jgi:hypothetical protein
MRAVTNAPETLVPSRTLCALAGITYRQCNYWTSAGWLHPADIERNRLPVRRASNWQPTPENPGSGWSRQYPLVEVSVAHVMRYLIERSHLSVARSALIARGYVEDDARVHDLCEHVTLTVMVPIPAWTVPET